jgi:hypothetical protein
MKKGIGLFGILVLSTMLGACAQSRRGANAGNQKAVLWQAQSLCANETGQTLYACFDITLNITGNEAYLDVQSMGFNPGETPYRILARRQGDSMFQLLSDNVTVTSGGRITVKAKKGHYIEEYETWRAELVINFDATDLEYSAPAGQGLAIMQSFVDYPELYE